MPKLAPPPSAAPPPPPLSDSDSVDSSSRGGYYGQHHYNYQSTSNLYQSRPAPVPTITNYGVSSAASDVKKRPEWMRGDSRVRPNIGETNDDFGGVGSLREVATRLRWMTIASTLSTVIWEGFAFPARLLVDVWLHQARVVIAAYLGFFALLLLGVELNAPMKDSFGILYHPLGRSALLFLMSSMCFGILEAWWEAVLGVAFLICSLGYVFAYWRYPEYRRWDDYNESGAWENVRTAIRRRTIPWANPTDDNIASGWQTVQRESQSLLHHV
eukprot:scaffold345_cov134-Cylindrotheca_fusiformis.AAC.67